MGKTRINSKWLSNCTGEELKQINRLRFKGDSMMYEDIILAPYHRDKIRVFFLKKDGKIIGWSSCLMPITEEEFVNKPIYPTSPDTEHTPVYTYVHSGYRKFGYGGRLLLVASKFAVKSKLRPTVFFWNEQSNKFFDSVRRKEPKLEVLDVARWWDLF